MGNNEELDEELKYMKEEYDVDKHTWQTYYCPPGGPRELVYDTEWEYGHA